MDVYLFALGAGFGGLLLMALMGLGHHFHVHHSSAGPAGSRGGQEPPFLSAKAPANPAHTHSAGHLPSPPQAHGAPGTHSNYLKSEGRGGALWLTLLSPRVFFSLLLGFGAAGVLLRSWSGVSSWWLLGLLSGLGGLAFESFLVQPFWKFLFGFASTPARTLEAAVCEEGHAATNFDGTGYGVVALALDGQVIQILGRLCEEDRLSGLRVRAGDRLFIRAVDTRRNACTVSKLG